MVIFIQFLVFFLLIIATAFFVASEFALVKMRASRLVQLEQEGVKNAALAKQVHTEMDAYLSACQLGITLTSLGLGWIGEPTVEKVIHPLFNWLHVPNQVATIISFVLAFAIVTFFHVVVGELVPKSFAIAKTEQLVLLIVKPLHAFYKTMYPFIWLLNHSAMAVSRMFGFEFAGEGDEAMTEEELRLTASESFKHGDINQSELLYLNRVFDFDNRLAKEVMIPRQEMQVLEQDMTIKEAMDFILTAPYTRYPVMQDSKDEIVGLLNIRDLTESYVKYPEKQQMTIQSLIQPIIQVIETIPIRDLLEKMREDQKHMAILLDEYGGTEGLVTAEDILEEIVGDLRDEYDIEEIEEIRKISENKYLISGKTQLEDLDRLFGTDFSEEEGVSTIGGWLLNQKYDAANGDIFEHGGLRIKLLEIEHFTVKEVEITVEVSEK